MQQKIRVVHYINQFFAGIGGEEKANTPPGVKEGACGPGKLLQSLLAGKGEVVATVYCGDNYINEHRDSALEEILKTLSTLNPSVVIAGPAFGSGRYGMACGSVCQAAIEKLRIPGLTGMHEENPAAELYRSRVIIASTGETSVRMKEAVSRIAVLAVKLAQGEPLGPADEEGYLSQGRKKNVFTSETGAKRSIDMLVKKMRGEAFVTELPLPKYDTVPPAAPLKDLTKATIALVTEGGCVPRGNPDRIESGWATKWAKYPLEGMSRLSAGEYESVHGGLDTTLINENPNRLVPLDILAEMEKEGDIGSLHGLLYSTVGNMGSLGTIKRFGHEIARELKAAKVDGVILTAT